MNLFDSLHLIIIIDRYENTALKIFTTSTIMTKRKMAIIVVRVNNDAVRPHITLAAQKCQEISLIA